MLSHKVTALFFSIFHLIHFIKALPSEKNASTFLGRNFPQISSNYKGLTFSKSNFISEINSFVTLLTTQALTLNPILKNHGAARGLLWHWSLYLINNFREKLFCLLANQDYLRPRLRINLILNIKPTMND